MAARLWRQILWAGLVLLIVSLLQRSPSVLGTGIREGLSLVVSWDYDFGKTLDDIVSAFGGKGTEEAPSAWARRTLGMLKDAIPAWLPVNQNNSNPGAGAELMPANGNGVGVMSWPIEGKVVAEFGWRKNPQTGREELNQGLDFEAYPGSAVRAAMKGEVKLVSGSSGRWILQLDHGDGLNTLYSGSFNPTVKKGDVVERGQIIGKMFKVSVQQGPVLHFEVLFNGTPIEPTTWLK